MIAQCFSTGRNFAPKGIWQRDIFLVVMTEEKSAPEAGESAKWPVIHRTALKINFPAQNVDNAKVEKLCRPIANLNLSNLRPAL